MASQKDREELDRRASKGETVIPSGTSGKSLKAQEHLAEERIRDGETRQEQLGREGYQEMGHKGGLSTGQERAEQEGGVETDESKSRTKS